MSGDGAESPSVTVRGPRESSMTIQKHGAHVTSWKTGLGEEQLFVSSKAVFKPPKAVRGGVPVCFPQFGTLGSLGQHGFARNSTFTLLSASKGTAVLQLEPTREHLKQFPFPFRLTVTVHVGENSLYQELKVENTGQEAFDFTAALHTYFNVSSIQQVAVEGLKNLQYFDNITGTDYKSEGDDPVHISGETDRIYRQAPNTISIIDNGAAQKVSIEKRGFPDAVLWNPWKDKAQGMSDFDDEEYKVMVCLEPALAKSGPKSLEPGVSWSASQTLTVSKL